MAVVWSIRRPKVFRTIGIDTPTGVHLWGPPGCGKTVLAKAVVKESQASSISVRGHELLNKARRACLAFLQGSRRLVTGREAGERALCRPLGTLREMDGGPACPSWKPQGCGGAGLALPGCTGHGCA
ncbi:hypothetical protein EDB87DRAFT_975540 [Lactarius vividus]|nr:hypothetical protein EDB87DRAFT_975540 [Lactarius vividus]